MNSNNKTLRFLKLSVVGICVLCLCIFVFLASYANKKGSETVSKVSSLYMGGLSERIQLHFGILAESHLSRVEDLTNVVPSGSSGARERLTELAEARSVHYLALCGEDGTIEMLYGPSVQVTDPDPFLASLRAGEQKIAVGTGDDGSDLVLLGVPEKYPMSDGEDSMALVAAVGVDEFAHLLFLSEDSSPIYSHIIRVNGTYVIRSANDVQENYLEHIQLIYDERSPGEAGQLVDRMQAAMEAGEPFSALLPVKGSDQQHMYCLKLPHSEWYLVTIMPYSTLNALVDELSSQYVWMVFRSFALILLVTVLIFLRYLALTRRQIQALEESKQSTERALQAAQAAQEVAEQAQVEAERAQVEAEQARAEAEDANKAKSQFLSNVSHDIRTPMNAIVGMTAIATANIDNQQQVQNCLKKITLSSKHLLGLINDVLDMSKIESGKMTLAMDKVSLREVMDSIVSIVQPQVKAKKQRFDVFIHDISVENVYCDSVRLNQVLLNLLSNAIKFTPDGGSIHVALWEERSPKGEGFVRIHIQVKDTGIGMSPEFAKKIFQSFTREDNTRVRKTEGTGLGMAITKYIIDTMGGTIQVQSEQGKGSEFNITLDLEKAEIMEEDMVLPDWRMLVVDDDQQLCESAVASLESIGVKADWTLSGEDAIRKVEEHHKRREDYHIILLDWKLPGMDGIATAREIRQQMGGDIPILLISAYDWSDIEDQARSAGINGFISKPLFKSTLFYGLRPFAGFAGPAQPAPAEQKTDFKGKKVLLAEDNDLNWEIAEELLSDLGLELEWAQNGQICLEKFQQSPVGFYHAILMDIRMPVMTGYEATEAIRALDRPDAKSIPIIAMTADAFAEDIKRCLDCGMNAHVSKPIDVREVSRQLEKFMR